MTASVVGWVLLALALAPALSPTVETGVTAAVGLCMVALAGLSMAFGFGEHRREWLLTVGFVLVAAGLLMQWRRSGGRLRMPAQVGQRER